MSQQNINYGTTPNDGTGDTLRNAAIKINSNFSETYQTGSLAYTQANNASSFANSAYTLANNITGVNNAQNTNISSAQSYANGAFGQANSAASFANGAFTAANSAASFANSAFSVANSAASFANGAFEQANNAASIGSSASEFANGAFAQANSAASFANGAFEQANSAASFANGAFEQANSAAQTIPQNAQTGDYTLTLSDAGKFIYYNGSQNTRLYIPTTANVAFSNGAVIMIVSQTSSGANVTINANSGVSLYLAGNTTSSNRNVTTYGVATLLHVKANTWFVYGTGIV
jgi:hypothetical protein